MPANQRFLLKRRRHRVINDSSRWQLLYRLYIYIMQLSDQAGESDAVVNTGHAFKRRTFVSKHHTSRLAPLSLPSLLAVLILEETLKI